MIANDGGPAFPFFYQGPTTAPEVYYGMSLRDHFAAHSPYTLADAERVIRDVDPSLSPTGEQIVATLVVMRWRYADAMLAAREVKS